MQRVPSRAPAVGDRVGKYRLVEEVGAGGQGLVFKAECAGQWFALKFYSAGQRAYGERERDILRALVSVRDVVRLVDWGEWPEPETGWLYLVLEWVEGWTLEAYVLEHNPSSREAGHLLLRLGRALVEVDARGVRHRDLKRENILVREDGGPVLVDFGVGAMEGVPTLPRGVLPPGTVEYVSPEAWRFLGEHKGQQAHYTSQVGDELWALGINFYWLLMGRLPFGSRVHMGAMLRAVVDQRPHVPHERNPRVPRALGEVCMRLLEKEPAARYADMAALCGALEEALASLEGDARWDAPLDDPDAPENRTTDKLAGLAVLALDTWERLQQELDAARPRRGRIRRPARPAPPLDAPPREEVPAPRVPGAARPAPGATPRVPDAIPALLVLMAAMVGALVFSAVQELASEPPGEVTASAVPPPARWLPEHPTTLACFVQEVAAGRESSEADGSATRWGASPSASAFVTALSGKEVARVKSLEKPAPAPRPRNSPRCATVLKRVCTAGVCTWMLTDCTGAPVRASAPQSTECPPGARKAMTELRIDVGCKFEIPNAPSLWHTVQLGYTSMVTVGGVEACGELPAGTVVSGPLFLAEMNRGEGRGETRAIIRYTQATTPEGKVFPVCMEAYRRDCQDPGAPFRPGSSPGTIQLTVTIRACTVERFE
ncbi:protein kinase domain-containing protein [Archangium sp.]|uniref:serine/threonine protein kinase n=1 Tax=Archangium sp. TaxID=1872627 RepID=UPI00286C6F8B|nr:protein kinase [Archangium sp.]